METYIALLRGINVSGKNMIKMVALKKMLESLQLQQVRTYIQSGNIVFQHKESSTEMMSQLIKTEIYKTYGFEVPVTILSLKKLEMIANCNPFLNVELYDQQYLHVTFLSHAVNRETKEFLLPYKMDVEGLNISDDVIYLYCPNGYGNTKLNNNLIERKLKVNATTRNWKTVKALIELGK